jgi:hypothetical protein
MKRKDIRKALGDIPIEQVLMVGKSELTGKQREFCKQVALGSTGAAAYRSAYKSNGKPRTQSNEASKLKMNPLISTTIDAMMLANEAMKYADASSLRNLVIHSLVQVLIDPDAKHATKVASAKVLGTVTEVAAFTERKEISHVQNSDAIKTQIMNQLKTMMLSTDDALTVDAHDLLAELVGDDNVKTRVEPSESGDYCDSDNADRTHPVPPDFIDGTPASTLHTIPLKPSDNLSDQDPGSPIPLQSTPLHLQNEDGGGDIFSENTDGCQDATGRVSTLKVKS